MFIRLVILFTGLFGKMDGIYTVLINLQSGLVQKISLEMLYKDGSYYFIQSKNQKILVCKELSKVTYENLFYLARIKVCVTTGRVYI
jgi:hypothetical protein